MAPATTTTTRTHTHTHARTHTQHTHAHSQGHSAANPELMADEADVDEDSEATESDPDDGAALDAALEELARLVSLITFIYNIDTVCYIIDTTFYILTIEYFQAAEKAGTTATSGGHGWFARCHWPWQATEEDKQVLTTWGEHCKVWLDAGSGFTLPADLFGTGGISSMKIHDWYCMCGLIGAYALLQCTGMSDDVRERCAALLFAMEHVTRKSVRKVEVYQLQQNIIDAIAGLMPVMPVHIMSTIVVEQLQHWSLQVLLGGPMHAHGTLDVESMMVFFKTLGNSRKNLAEGIARAYELSERAYLWQLEEADLEPSACQKSEFTIELPARKMAKLVEGDSREQPLSGVLGLLVADKQCLPLVGEYYSHVRDIIEANKTSKNRKGYQRADIPVLQAYRPLDGVGGGGRREQTNDEVEHVAKLLRLSYYKSCVVRGTKFTTRAEANKRTTDNSGVCIAEAANEGATSDKFGTIRDIVGVRQLDGKVRFAIHVNWHKTVGSVFGGAMEVVTRGVPSSDENRLYSCVWLEDVHAMNIAFWPLDLRKPRNSKLVVIYRLADYRTHHK
jgi:hypothetical protein